MGRNVNNKVAITDFRGQVLQDAPHIVRVVRYFRSYASYDQVSPHGGMTAICELDYGKMELRVYPTWCAKDDNFSKELGKANAAKSFENNMGFKVPLDRGDTIFGNIMRGVENETLVWTCDDTKRVANGPFMRWYRDNECA
jgi:hypothetical protein